MKWLWRIFKFIAWTIGLILALIVCLFFAQVYKIHSAVSAYNKLIDQADRIQITNCYPENDPTFRRIVLFESRAPKDINELKAAIQIKPTWGNYLGKARYCACLGNPWINLYKGDQFIGRITYHHGVDIRCEGLLPGNIPLADQELCLKWFDDRGIYEPRKEVTENKIEAERYVRAQKKWLAAMPPSLKPYFEQMKSSQWGSYVPKYDKPPEPNWVSPYISPNLVKAIDVLKKEFPDQDIRVRKLFYSFGAGEGSWSGFPCYEQVIEDMLIEESHEELIRMASRTDLTNLEMEGAARVLASWNFQKYFSNTLQKMSPEVKKRLLDHVLNTPLNDKAVEAEWGQDRRDRALAAFRD